MKIKANKIATASMALVTALSPIMYSLPVNAAAPALSNTSVSVNVGKTVTLSMKNVKSGTKVAWKSSNKKIATVSSKGVVKGIRTGSAYVYATVSKKQYKCKVTVNKSSSNVKVQSIGLTSTIGTTVQAGSSGYIIASVSPSNAKNRTVSYKSNNTKVVSISKSGKFNAKKAGDATITVTAADGSKVSSTISIHVNPFSTPVSSVKIVVADGYSDKIYVDPNNGTQLKAYVSPSNATNRKVMWESLNQSIATVNGDGWVVGRSAGTATIRVTALDGSRKYSTIKITVCPTGEVGIRKVAPKSQTTVRKLLNIFNFGIIVDPSAQNSCDGQTRSIVLSQYSDDFSYHEIGHVIEYITEYVGGSSIDSIYASERSSFPGNATRISNSSEYFAEAYAMYTKSPSTLRTTCPQTYNYIRNCLTKVLPKLVKDKDLENKVRLGGLTYNCGK